MQSLVDNWATLLKLKEYKSIVSSASINNINALGLHELAILLESCIAISEHDKIVSIWKTILKRCETADPHDIPRLITLAAEFLVKGGVMCSYDIYIDSKRVLKALSGTTETILRTATSIFDSIIASFENRLDTYVTGYRNLHDTLSPGFHGRPYFYAPFDVYVRKSANYAMSKNACMIISDRMDRIQKGIASVLHSQQVNLNSNVLISVESDYYFTFLPRLMELASDNPAVHFHLLYMTPSSTGNLIPEGIKIGAISDMENLTMYKCSVPVYNPTETKTLSCCFKYLLLPIFLNYHSDILLLDIDLDLREINLSQLIKKCRHDQAFLGETLVQTFLGSCLDVHSALSAGFLFASRGQMDLYEMCASYIETCFRLSSWSWGLDPAALVVSMSMTRYSPIMMPSLTSVTSCSKIWSVTPEEQMLKASLRTY
jgi:hypothetical protein